MNKDSLGVPIKSYSQAEDCLIAGMPEIEVEPVRHGRWLETDYFDAHKVPIYQCSVCFREVADNYIKYHKYCLHCGAKMDLKKD